MISPPILADLMADPGNCPSAAWTATTTQPCRWRSCCLLCGRHAVSRGVGQVPLFGLWVKGMLTFGLIGRPAKRQGR